MGGSQVEIYDRRSVDALIANDIGRARLGK
jgi:hypothetical protein